MRCHLVSAVVTSAVLWATPLHAEEANPASQPSRFRQLWSEAESATSRQDHAAAALQYRAILSQFPQSQRTALRVAVNEEKAGRIDQALTAYDAALTLNPRGAWVDVALFYKARALLGAGNRREALTTVEHLRQQFPDSSYAIRALTLQAQARGACNIETRHPSPPPSTIPRCGSASIKIPPRCQQQPNGPSASGSR